MWGFPDLVNNVKQQALDIAAKSHGHRGAILGNWSEVERSTKSLSV